MGRPERVEGNWCRIDKGEVTFLDWYEAERLSDLYAEGGRRDGETRAAHIMVAVRECVLRAKRRI